jgi:asparagine synthase (glutamine-hydrolysing)
VCDTEIIPHLYEQYGPDFPTELRGMFGIAVWDRKERRAIIARDRLGIKPMYYAQAGGMLIFASELKSVLASGLVRPDLDHEAIEIYLTLGFFPGPYTPLAGVSKLMPGHVLVADERGVSASQYWAYPRQMPDRAFTDVNQAGEALLALLDESVRLRLMSEVPLGAMLSGGLDSSLIVALMSRHMTEAVKTFSVGFTGTSAGNELADARTIAEAFGTEHHELELPVTSDVDLASIVWSLDEPLADLSTIGFSALSQLAREHVTVALSGQGADELLGGYSRHRAASLIGIHSRAPRPLQALFALGGRFEPRVRRLDELARLDPASRFVAMKNHRPAAAPPPTEAATEVVRKALAGESSDPLATTLYLDAQLGLVDDMLHYFDRMSMAHSLEVRVPFLDHKVVELCATIPSKYKVRRLTTKYALKHAARGVIPDAIIDKPKVGFFNNAVGDWTRHALEGAVTDYLLAPEPRYTDFVERSQVERFVTRSREGAAERSDFLLAVLMLEIWLSSYLPRATRLPAAEAPLDVARV